MRPDIHMYRAAATTRKTSLRNRFAPATSRFAGMLAAAVLLLACGDSSSGPDTQVASVAVSPTAKALVVGDATTLQAVVKNRAGEPLEGREVEWTTSDPAIAEVSLDGDVEAVGVGRATITATSEGRSGTARIDVSALPPAAVDRVALDVERLRLRKYASQQLVATAYDADGNVLEGRTVTWISQTPEIAGVDETGRVIARAEGEARIVAAVDGRSANAHIFVDPAPVARVVLSADGPEMDRGEVQSLAIRLEDERGLELTQRTVVWSSSSAAAEVTGDGAVFARADGTATITATSEGKSASVELRIVAPPAFDLIYDRPTAAGGAEIFLLGLGRPTAPRKLNAGNVSSDPSAHPDGLRYVFAVSQRDLTTGQPINDLFVVNVNGMAMRRLTTLPGIEREPAWSPDGSRIAFSAIDERGRTDIWTVNADGTGLQNLTSALGEWSGEHAPSWSPDGSRIAFSVSSNGIFGAVWTMRADGTDAREVETDVGFGLHPTWSPDGTRIAFGYLSGAATGADIAIVPVTGGAATKLAVAGEQLSPAWSPDGALLAVMGRDATGTLQLWTMRPDGTGLRARTSGASGTGRNPSWIAR